MANANATFGLRPVRASSVRRYYVPASDGTPLFIGDPVVLAGSADATGTAATVTRATAGGGGRVTGAVVGFEPSPLIEANGYRAASTAAFVLVSDDPHQIYEIQEDSAGGALSADDIGLNADLVAGNGSTATRLSGFQLDTSTKGSTATLQLRIVGLVDRADNEMGANAKVLVRLNMTTETPAAGSTGV